GFREFEYVLINVSKIGYELENNPIDVPKCDAPSVAPRVCKDLDELNFAVQQLRNEVACTSHAYARKTKYTGEESHKIEDGGVAESREGRGKSETLGSVTKRQRAVVKETPCQGREIPNISEDTIGDPPKASSS
ncbi:unnamed protein product, partial [Prunus brigantina]